jgi:hypothetical protein
VEPFTLSAIGAVALTKGIDFLYGQAAEVLKHWRERKRAAEEGSSDRSPAPMQIQDPGVLEGRLQPAVIDVDALERLSGDLEALCERLGSYRAGAIREVDPQDQELAAVFDGVRQALEAIYQQRITFKGEHREQSGPVLVGRIDVTQVEGTVRAIRAKTVRGAARLEGEVKADRIAKGGEAAAVDVDTVEGI